MLSDEKFTSEQSSPREQHYMLFQGIPFYLAIYPHKESNPGIYTNYFRFQMNSISNSSPI